MSGVDKARWARLSPLLDELLDLDAAARDERLLALRAGEPALADELQAQLERMAALDRDAFLASPARLPAAAMAGETIGAYRVERELGQGGMGSVWLAQRTDGRFEGQVAIKFLDAALVSRGGSERFAREGSILARLAHPNIARLLDAGVARDGRLPYLVLEYVDGVPIDRHCDERALDVGARIRLFLDVLAAVTHAHNRLILHRDLKPSNILVTATGDVKLLDFGIAKLLQDADAPQAASELTRDAGRAFTLQYAAPEQLQGGDVTTATDVYALGVLLYVLLGGTHPTAAAATAPLEQMRAAIENEPRRVSDAAQRRVGAGNSETTRLARALRGDLDNIVARALKKSPAERYANAAQFADDLRRHLNHEPVAARPDALSYRLGKFLRRNRVGVAAASTVTLALAAGLGMALSEAREAQRQRMQAEGLVEFMLGDLRRKLQPVGRLEVLDGVGARALAYYEAQDADSLDADSLGRRARALHLIGEIAERRSSLDEALRTFQRAADSTAELMARYPRDAQRLFDHAQSVYWVGFVARKRGEIADAEASFRSYRALALQLTELDPDNVDWRVESAYAGQNLGVLLLESARPAPAMQAFVEARDTWDRVVRARPALGAELANTWGWIAKAHEALGRFDAATQAQHAKIDLLRRLPAAATDRDAQRLVANADHELGRLELAQGRLDAARLSTQRALDQYAALVAADPSNMAWLAQMSFVRTSLAEIHAASGARAAGRADIERAAADVRRLLATDATRGHWNVTLRGQVLLQRLALEAPQAAHSAELEAFLADVAPALASGKPVDAEQGLVVAGAELQLGDLLARAQHSAAARRRWQAAAARLQGLADGQALPAMTLLAHARLRLDQGDAARALARHIEASPYRHPAYADLRNRMAAAAGATASQ